MKQGDKQKKVEGEMNCEFIKGCTNKATKKINGEWCCRQCIDDTLSVLQEIKILKEVQNGKQIN